MVDLDIPSNQNPHTFLHWMQTDLAPATRASSFAVSNGTTQGFALSNAKKTGALVPYTQPNPPAQNPLSHRYTQILVDTSSMTQASLSALQSAAQTRVGFDAASVLEAAGLSSNVVAGNSFNVTNPDQTVSSASFSNFSSNSIGDSTGNIQGSGQVRKPDNDGFKGFGATNGGEGIMGGGTLTTTISSVPAGPTSVLTQAGTSGSATSAVSKTFSGLFAYPLMFLVVLGFFNGLSSSL